MHKQYIQFYSFYIILLLPLVTAEHTKYYNQNWTGNNTKLFFDSRTFGIDLYFNPCEIVTNTQYREYINRVILCNETWCVNNKYYCPSYTSRNCYEVEHIYDINRPEYSKYRNIIGNRVMAWGKWNGALGLLSYNDSLNEKYDIYGENAMIKVQKQIYKCQNRRYKARVIAIVLVIFIVIATSIAICSYYSHTQRKNNNHRMMIEIL